MNEMMEAAKIIALKSPAAMSGGVMQLIRAIAAKSPLIQTRYNQIAEYALNDMSADFTPEEKAKIVGCLGVPHDGQDATTVTFRLTQEERNTIAMLAEDDGFPNLSAWIRYRLGLGG